MIDNNSSIMLDGEEFKEQPGGSWKLACSNNEIPSNQQSAVSQNKEMDVVVIDGDEFGMPDITPEEAQSCGQRALRFTARAAGFVFKAFLVLVAAVVTGSLVYYGFRGASRELNLFGGSIGSALSLDVYSTLLAGITGLTAGVFAARSLASR